MSGGMVESPAKKNKSRSFRDAESLGLINKERINSQEQNLRRCPWCSCYRRRK